MWERFFVWCVTPFKTSSDLSDVYVDVITLAHEGEGGAEILNSKFCKKKKIN